MSTHVDKLVSICFFHLRQLRLVCRTLDVDAAHALVRTLIHSRLDYCNCVGWTASIHVQVTPVCLECGCLACPSVTWPSECQFRWQRSCTGSDFHIESRTSCASWSTKVCMDRHLTICPDDVFEFATFLAVHISGRFQLDSSWC